MVNISCTDSLTSLLRSLTLIDICMVTFTYENNNKTA